MNYAEILATLVWPLICLILALVLIRHVRADVQPIMIGIVKGLAAGSSKNPLFYAMAWMIGMSASLGALADVAHAFGWKYVEAFARVAQPFFVGVIAYVIKPPSPSIADTNNPPVK